MIHIVNFFKMIVETMDQHEGMVAMVGIAVTVFIFMREVSNNYFTMEQDNFKDIFKDLVLKQLPEKIDRVELAEDELSWNNSFKELMDVLNEILAHSKYYKYSIPFFYECLRLRIEEIGDLERYGWRLCRSSVRQNTLIKKKCRAIIRNINDASKGRVFAIKFYQNKLIQKIRQGFIKNFCDYPADRIVDIYTESELIHFTYEVGEGKTIQYNDLKKLNSYELTIISSSNQVHITDVKAIDSKQAYYFGYVANLRWGKRIGKPCIKAKSDNSVHISHIAERATIRLKDSDVHKLILMWTEERDNNHIHFSMFNVRNRQKR